MGFFRFRRSICIAPWLRVNVSKSGASTSVGQREAYEIGFGHAVQLQVFQLVPRDRAPRRTLLTRAMILL